MFFDQFTVKMLDFSSFQESFINFVRKERRFKLAASFSFFILVFCIGVPMWHYTTSAYRANFPTFSENRTISVPIRVIFAATSSDLEQDVKKMMRELETNVTTMEVVAPLNFEWTTKFLGIR